MMEKKKFQQAAASARPDRLYHATRYDLTGDALLPKKRMTVNGVEDDYLFGAVHLAKTMMFAFDWRAGEVVLAGFIDGGSGDEFVIVCNRTETLKKRIDLKVYSFPSAGFSKTFTSDAYGHDINYDTGEYHTTSPVPVSSLKLEYRITHVDDIMRHGLQIISTDKTRADLEAEGFFARRKECADTFGWLRSLLDSGQFTWENGARGLGANRALRDGLEKHGGVRGLNL